MRLPREESKSRGPYGLTKQIKCPQPSHLLRRFWENATGFWGKRGTRLSWVLSGILLLTILLNLATSYGMNVWTRGIFDALQEKDSHTVLSLALVYLPLLAASVVFGVLQVYARMTTQRRWREWLTNQLVNRWLKNGRYYHLNLVSGGPGNPEYRVADDIRIATESPVDFATGMITAVLSATTFIVILWTIGGTLTIQFSGMAVTIPGFLVVAAVIYAVAASGSMVLIGRRFIAVSENKNQAEAEYRYVLTRLRENGESIALLQGEDEERNGVDKSLKMVLRAWRDICIQTMRTTIVSQTSSYIAPVLPIILCAPKFLDGTMTLGEIMPGEKVLVTGESGSGKSTLVRALAGLWPWGGGEIEMPAGAKLLVLPQRAYVPSGTLRRAANYPEAADSRSVEEIANVLKKVGLGHLIEHLDEERPWDQILSGGEKQRLAFARVFLHRPDIILLDEATAALDSQSEDRLMELLSQEFKHATVVSVGHRSELEALHGRKIILQRGRRGAKLASDVYRNPKPILPRERPSMGLLSLWNSSLARRTFRQAEPASRM